MKTDGSMGRHFGAVGFLILVSLHYFGLTNEHVRLSAQFLAVCLLWCLLAILMAALGRLRHLWLMQLAGVWLSAYAFWSGALTFSVVVFLSTSVFMQSNRSSPQATGITPATGTGP
jgi:hypothetical protein